MFNLNKIASKSSKEIHSITESLSLNLKQPYSRNLAINSIVNHYESMGEQISFQGIVDIIRGSYGFLRSFSDKYPLDVYLPIHIIKKYVLRTGDFIEINIRSNKSGEKYLAAKSVLNINGIDTKNLVYNRPNFEELTPEYPHEKFLFDNNDITTRLIDIFAPIGKGQRGLIVAPPKTGKTTILQSISTSIISNNPECRVICLLVGERPEEVTEMKRLLNCEIVASTFDESPFKHVSIAEITIERAKRMVENKEDVVIILDSLTRLTRAYNFNIPSSGRSLSGGIDVQALEKPKNFFGSARKLVEGGSLTIIASVLVDTGSKMDDVIYEEFKGTGNMEIYLLRKLAEKRIFPALDIIRSSTRKENLLVTHEQYVKTSILRRIIYDMDSLKAFEFLTNKLLMSKDNKEFFLSMNNKNI